MTEYRVYGGDPRLVHIADGTRTQVGSALADQLDATMRQLAGEGKDKPLCVGCVMVTGFNMLVVCADRNGQTRTELANTMIKAFEALRDNPNTVTIEEIEVILDPC